MNGVPGHRERTFLIDELRAKHPGHWLALTDVVFDEKKEISGARVIAASTSVEALDQAILYRGDDMVVLPPRTHTEMFDEQYGACSSYEERRALFERMNSKLQHPALVATLAAISLARSAIFIESPHAYTYMILNRWVPRLYRSTNFVRSLLVVGADDRNKSRGHFHELLEAYNRSNEHGDEVVATQLMIEVPISGKNEKTDVDVLTADGRWLEIKRYKRTLTLHDLKRKLNVLGEALKQNIVVSVGGKDVRIQKIELHALKTVAEPAKRYARERGIVVYEHSVYPLRSRVN